MVWANPGSLWFVHPVTGRRYEDVLVRWLLEVQPDSASKALDMPRVTWDRNGSQPHARLDIHIQHPRPSVPPGRPAQAGPLLCQRLLWSDGGATPLALYRLALTGLRGWLQGTHPVWQVAEFVPATLLASITTCQSFSAVIPDTILGQSNEIIRRLP